jgi:hypothetical protein
MTEPGLKDLEKVLEQILDEAKARQAKKESFNPTTLNPIIYGADKSIDFKKFDGGAVVRAIAQDLEEFGEKGVQGVSVQDCERFVNYHRARRDLEAPYIQAGVVKGALVLVMRDEERGVEAMDVLIKDYVALKEKLKKSSVSVTNIEPVDEGGVIARATDRMARRLGATRSQNPDYGEITGNIVLGAHGMPDARPSGRIIAENLGMKTPEDIFKLLTRNKDPKQRVGKDYNGTLTLSGCFTASGGPEAAKQDDPYAKKVLELFRKKGYKKISVVGYPGAAITAASARTDTHGTRVEEGDKLVRARAGTGEELARKEKLESAAAEAIKKHTGLVNKREAAKADLEKSRAAVRKAIQDSGLSRKMYLKTPEGQAGFEEFDALKATYEEVGKQVDDAKDAMETAKKALKDSGLQDTWARLEGRFGLRTVN